MRSETSSRTYTKSSCLWFNLQLECWIYINVASLERWDSGGTVFMCDAVRAHRSLLVRALLCDTYSWPVISHWSLFYTLKKALSAQRLRHPQVFSNLFKHSNKKSCRAEDSEVNELLHLLCLSRLSLLLVTFLLSTSATSDLTSCLCVGLFWNNIAECLRVWQEGGRRSDLSVTH